MTALTAMACATSTRKYPAGRTGTYAGYLAHLKAPEVACLDCKEALAIRTALKRGASPEEYAEYRQALAKYRASVEAGNPVPVCVKPSPGYPQGRTGTRAGYGAHVTANEAACDACLKGNARQVADDRIADPLHVLRGNLANKYNLSLERYHEILRAQDGRCAICGVDSPTDIRTSRFHVDHDHSCCPGSKSCGRCVRGLLCHACNTALGNFKDDPDVLLAALSYLLSHGKEAAE